MEGLRIAAKSIDCRFYGEIVSDVVPEPGAVLTVLDYPTVTRYRVLRHEDDRRDMHWYPHERLTLILEPIGVAARSTRPERPIGIEPATDLLVRLERIGKLARSYLPEQPHLRICHADFKDLCERSGLSNDLTLYDGLAYFGTPMTVREEGEEWNASTVFEGYNPDMSILRVTLPGGIPFVMDANLLDISKRIVAGELDEAGATGEIYFHLRKRRLTITTAIARGIDNLVGAMVEGVMPPYDGAQELVALAVCPARFEEEEPTCEGASGATVIQFQSAGMPGAQ